MNVKENISWIVMFVCLVLACFVILIVGADREWAWHSIVGSMCTALIIIMMIVFITTGLLFNVNREHSDLWWQEKVAKLRKIVHVKTESHLSMTRAYDHLRDKKDRIAAQLKRSERSRKLACQYLMELIKDDNRSFELETLITILDIELKFCVPEGGGSDLDEEIPFIPWLEEMENDLDAEDTLLPGKNDEEIDLMILKGENDG